MVKVKFSGLAAHKVCGEKRGIKDHSRFEVLANSVNRGDVYQEGEDSEKSNIRLYGLEL